MTANDLVNRWFPGKDDITQQTILFELTAFPVCDSEILERQLIQAAIKTMPELPGFEERLSQTMLEIYQND